MGKVKMNKKVRLCLVKIFENGNYFYKIEGALFIVSILNSSKAFGYHLKKQGGQTLGEYNLVINANVLDENYKKNEATSDSIFDEQCSCGSDYLLKECCLNLEWDTDLIIGLPILIIGAVLVINQKIKSVS